VPVAYSQGFTPHPKVSYVGAAPTGVASEAEYLEIGLQARVDPEWLRGVLDEALSPGLDVLAAVADPGGASLADRIDASRWRIELDGVSPAEAAGAVTAFLGASEVLVERLTKQGRRRFDARAAVERIEVVGDRIDVVPDVTSAPGTADGGGRPGCAILDLVVRQVIPSVRPDDVLAGLKVAADLEPPVPPRVTRLAQGKLTALGELIDPLHVDREAAERDGTVIGHPSS
jgi:radical SAM-linked protein